ncbi:HAD family hydrolase [Halorientalis pallida]|uniref:HAD family hydrolase n=1 Tax=Halorientalis pallida TaxID=2479928 RepID=A0A498L071_9EURY|nr:HAD family hydrolase [Halorientalis pallida]RXK50233.1 HAD family hydrolase [Halorientalis pallida]
MTAAIFFAVEGTLLERTESPETVAERGLETVLGEAGPALVETYLDTVDQRPATDPAAERAGAAAVADAVDGDPDPDALVEAVREAEIEATTVPEAARSGLSALAESDHLGVLTNRSRDWQAAVLAAHDLDGLFETVVTAPEAGAAKPDPAIYEHACEQVDADEYVMVGDDYEADVEAAREAGFVPIHYEDDGPSLWGALDALV